MFKFETFARVLVAVLVFNFSLVLAEAAEKGSGSGIDCIGISNEIVEMIRKDKPESAIDSRRAAFNECMAKQEKLVGKEKCDDDEKDLKESLGKFRTACNGAGFPGGIVECVAEIRKCGCAVAKDDSAEARKMGCPANDSKYAGRPTVNFNLSKMDYMAKLCPPLAAGDLKDLRDEAKEAREKIRELEKSMDEANEAATQAQADAQKELGEIADQGKEAANTAMQEQKEIRNSVRDSKAQLQEKITQLNAQRQEIDGRVAQYLMEGQKADLSYQQSVTQLKTTCHARAIAEIAEKRKVDLLLAAQQPKGGQAALLKKIGTSIEKDYRRQAKRRYEQCMVDLATTETKKDLLAARNLAIDNMNAQAQAEQEKRKEIATQINTMQAPCGVATGTVSGTSELCQITTDAQQDMMAVGMKLQAERAAINRKMQTASSAAAAKAAAQNAKAGRARGQIMEEQARLRELEAVIAIKSEAGVDETHKQSYREAHAEYPVLGTKAQAFVPVCCDGKTSETCKSAQRIVELIDSPIKAPGDGSLRTPEDAPKPGDAKR